MFEPFYIRVHNMKCVAALFLSVGFFELHEIALSDVAAVNVAKKSAKQIQRERVTSHFLNQRLEFFLTSLDFKNL